MACQRCTPSVLHHMHAASQTATCGLHWPASAHTERSATHRGYACGEVGHACMHACSRGSAEAACKHPPPATAASHRRLGASGAAWAHPPPLHMGASNVNRHAWALTGGRAGRGAQQRQRWRAPAGGGARSPCWLPCCAAASSVEASSSARNADAGLIAAARPPSPALRPLALLRLLLTHS